MAPKVGVFALLAKVVLVDIGAAGVMRRQKQREERMVTTNWAFAQYENVRARLPQALGRGQAKRVGHLFDLVDEFDVFLLDAFGVLNVGDTAIEGAPGHVAALQAAGKRVMVLTNGASFPAAVSLAKYRRFGYDFSPEDVISSRDILVANLARFPDILWGAMAPEGAELGSFGAPVIALGEKAEDFDRVGGFLFIGSGQWTEAQQAMALESLQNNPRPLLVGNPDIVAPREGGFSLEPGWFAHEIARQTQVEPQFFGKPFGGIFAEAARRFGPVPAERVAMVGDTLHTDILGGAAAGFKTVLIEAHGLFKGHDTAPFIARSGIMPDFLAPTS